MAALSFRIVELTQQMQQHILIQFTSHNENLCTLYSHTQILLHTCMQEKKLFVCLKFPGASHLVDLKSIAITHKSTNITCIITTIKSQLLTVSVFTFLFKTLSDNHEMSWVFLTCSTYSICQSFTPATAYRCLLVKTGNPLCSTSATMSCLNTSTTPFSF